MSWLSKMVGGGEGYKDPSEAAMPYLQKNEGVINDRYNPYINRGNAAGDIAQGQYDQMATNPQGYYDQIYSGYEESPYAKYQSEQMHRAAENSAAAGGFSGTQTDTDHQTEIENALLSMDWNKYLDSIMGINNQGLNGEMDFFNTGYNASNNAANGMINNNNAMAGLEYNSVADENAYNQAQQNSLLKSLAQAGGMATGFYNNGGFGGMGGNALPFASPTQNDMYWG